MTRTGRDIPSLIGSRICHDLISPLGAVSNGVELMSLSHQDSEELSLIGDSITSANARIRLFRIAFGAAIDGQLLSRLEVEAVLAEIYGSAKLDVTWAGSEDPLRAEAKLALLLLMCVEVAMPWGGTVRISCDDGCWKLLARADRLKLDADLWEVLSNASASAAIEPAHVQFPLAFDAAERLNRKPTVELSEDLIQIEF